MSKPEIEAVFKRDLNDAPEYVRSFYHYCRRKIATARWRKKQTVHIYGHTYAQVVGTTNLLTHARNGFKAYAKVEPTHGGRPYVAIDLTQETKKKRKKKS